MNFNDFKSLLGQTVSEPEAAARRLIAAGLPMPVRWMLLVLVVTVSAMLAWLSSQLAPLPEGGASIPILNLISQPLFLAGVQFFAILLASGLMAGVGQMFGGKGRFDDALLLTIWIEVVLLVVQAAQVVISFVLSAGLAALIGFATIAIFLYLTVQFTKALHGFTSGVKVLLGMIGTAFVAGFALSFIAAILGVMPVITQ